jgi:hypothetical protein|nr:MAG TPA: Rifin [Caudoviricetes sp.]
MDQNFDGMDSAINNSKPMIQQQKQLVVINNGNSMDHGKYQNAINYYLIIAVVIVCILLAIFYVFHSRK